METPGGGPIGAGSGPTASEAHETLSELAQDRDAVRYPPFPRWFFPVMAVVVAALHLVRLLDDHQSQASLAVTAMALLLGSRFWWNRDDAVWVSVSLRDMAGFLVVFGAVFVACWVVSDTTGATWAWAVGAVLNGALVLVTGRAYRRAYGDDR